MGIDYFEKIRRTRNKEKIATYIRAFIGQCCRTLSIVDIYKYSDIADNVESTEWNSYHSLKKYLQQSGFMF